MNTRIHQYFLFLSVMFFITACNDDGATPDSATNSPVTQVASTLDIEPAAESAIRDLFANYLLQIDSDYSDVSEFLEKFSASIETLIEAPSTESLDSARSSWIEAINAYELTVIHRYFADVVMAEPASLEFFQLQYQINHWPILPGYVDYVAEYPQSGIVNDMTVSLEAENLRQQHGEFDVNEAVTGFHVIEFLLWGENLIAGPRPLTDFQEKLEPTAQQRSDGIAIDDLSNNRRRELLSQLTRILVEDFSNLMTVWSEGSTDLRLKAATLEGGQLLLFTLDAMTRMLTEELLVKSLYPMLNAEYSDSQPAPFSQSSQNIASSHLSALERLLLEYQSDESETLDEMLTGFSTEYAEFFLPSFDASKECLIVLYGTDLASDPDAEFKVVECINLLTNMIDYLEQLKVSITL